MEMNYNNYNSISIKTCTVCVHMAHEKAYQTTITYSITVSLILFFFILLFTIFAVHEIPSIVFVLYYYLDGRTKWENCRNIEGDVSLTIVSCKNYRKRLILIMQKRRMKTKGFIREKKIYFGDLFLDIRVCVKIKMYGRHDEGGQYNWLIHTIN